MTPDVDLETLRLLLLVSEHGSIGAAAREAGISQPAASGRIRAFETRWRIRFVERTARGSALTDDGEAVVAWARRVVHEADLMRESLAAMGRSRQQDLRVAASLTVAEYLMPLWLSQLQARHADVRPRLQVINSRAVADLVRAGQVDIGFLETYLLPEDLHCKLIGRDRLVIVVAPDHPWARRSSPLTRRQLAEASYVLREEGSGTRSTFEAALGSEPPQALEVSSTASILGAAQAGVGPGVVSHRAAVHAVEAGRLVEVSHELDLRRPLTAVWRREEPLREQAGRLLRIAEAALRR
ncbi:LysR family transcriptional regulator [Nocardioides alcanivorans]|uniref:LysR family transcriptional regulator n=1 Tax=Nocardioides alcanivorans TaxID=2897352 RepID=UPI001F2958C8|nr:LysR family transcriptional regulator [Nocardioides alcanivorans]